MMEKWLEEAIWNTPVKMTFQGKIIICSPAQLKELMDKCIEDALFRKDSNGT